MWCPKCQKRTQSKFSSISITGIYWTLKIFGVCSEDEFKKLLKEGKVFSVREKINIYGNPIEIITGDSTANHNKHEDVHACKPSADA
jgi:uncharacterized protein (UPF0212 family)